MMYDDLKNMFRSSFGMEPEMIFSAPGRSELCGNHTDHQCGLVLACAVDLETRAAVRPRKDGVIRLLSEGYPMCEVNLENIKPQEAEFGTTASLIRGVAAGMAGKGFQPVGFDAAVTSSVLSGSGLSSSAAFEILLGTIENELTGAGLSAMELAEIGKLAENVYYGKPSGLLDQAAAASGGAVLLNFAPGQAPTAEKIEADFEKLGYALCVIDSGADHAELTEDYAAIPKELGKVCAFFGKKVLAEVEEEEFMQALPELRKGPRRCGKATCRLSLRP